MCVCSFPLSDISHIWAVIPRQPVSKRVLLPQPKDHTQEQLQLLPLPRDRGHHWSGSFMEVIFTHIIYLLCLSSNCYNHTIRSRGYECPNGRHILTIPDISSTGRPFPYHSQQSLLVSPGFADHWSWGWLFWFRPRAGIFWGHYLFYLFAKPYNFTESPNTISSDL